MKITILAIGTLGDVQPLVALGQGLKMRGHQVRMVAGKNFGSWIEGHGLEVLCSSVDMQALMKSEDGQEWVEHGNQPYRQMRAIKRLAATYGPAMMRDAWTGCEDAEVVVSNFTSDVYAASIVEKTGASHIITPLQPTQVATRSGMVTPQAPVPGRNSLANYLFGKWLVEPLAWRLYGTLNNHFRRETLGLSPQTYRQNRARLRRALVVQGFSAKVVPHPTDWPPNFHTAGYWVLEEDPAWQPPPALSAFLGAGEPPVYIGFGSMTGRDPDALTRLLIEAAGRANVRAILQMGWAELGGISLPETVYLLDRAPHTWLFPRLRAVVHHGGAGTTGAGLRAGIPTIVVPHMADQPFWGARVAALGVGPRPIPRHKLEVGNLAAAIKEAVGDPGMVQRAGALGQVLRAEDGVSTALGLIEASLA